MDRVNRSKIFNPALIAITAVFLTVSVSHAEGSGVQLAVGHGGDESGAIQQVAGKQPKSRQTRPGLLQVLTGAQPKGSTNHQHQNMPKGDSKGLLDVLFNGSNSKTSKSNSSQAKSSRSNQAARSRSMNSTSDQDSRSSSSKQASTSSASKKRDVSWDGIPYHRANATRNDGGVQPIRDPMNNVASDQGAMRIIRGGSSRTIEARPASARRTTSPASALSIPQPPQDIEEAAELEPVPSRSLSTSSSSRRSNRRSIQALDASEIAAASIRPEEDRVANEPDEVEDLVPRVARREVKSQPKPAPQPEAVADTRTQPTAAHPTVAPRLPRQPVPSQDVASKAVGPTPALASGIPAKPEAIPAVPTPPSQDPESRTAVAAIGAPMPTAQSVTEPTSSADIQPRPATTIPAPIVATPTPAATPTANVAVKSVPPVPTNTEPAYTTPVEPQPATHPYAASTPVSAAPATTASHRVGPPSGAFSPGTGSAGLYNASTPVGSGVVPNSGVASYRRQAEPSYPTNDPSSLGNTSNGYQAASPQPYDGYAPTNPIQPNPNQIADNFAATTSETRNQMRDMSRSTGATAAASELPGIRVATYGPSEVMIRQTNQYEIRVENRGSIDASGVVVRAVVPNWAEVRGQNATRGNVDMQSQGNTERMVWTIDHLPAGASERMFVRLTAAQSGTYDLDVDWTTLPQKNVAKVKVHEPRLNLTIEGPDQVVYGKSQTYKVRVLNPGDGTAPNVVFTLSPNSATPQSQRIGDIPPGKEAQFDVELTAQDLGDLKIHGLAAGDLELRAEAAKTIRVAAANLEAVLTGPEVKYQNTEAMYSLQLQNTGAASSEKIIATLRMPAGVKYLGGIEEAVMQGNALKWEVSSLAPGVTRDYQFRCNMTSTGEHLFAFDCKGTAAGNTDVSIATRVDSIADLVLTVSDPAAPAPIGSDVTYEIVIRNRGSKEATDVRAIAQFSHGIEPQRIEGQSGEVVTGQVLFDPIPRVGPGQEIRLRVIAQASRAGHHRFRTEVRSGDTVLVAEEATHYMSPQSDRVSRRSANATTR